MWREQSQDECHAVSRYFLLRFKFRIQVFADVNNHLCPLQLPAFVNPENYTKRTR